MTLPAMQTAPVLTLKKSDRTREEILRAAARLFRDRGYHASTLREIAQEAQIKAGSIYYHFGSKDEIIDEVLDLGLRQVFNAVEAVIAADRENPDHRARIGRAIRAHLDLLVAHGEFTSANIRIYGQLPEDVRARHRPLRRQYAQLWEDLLAEARDAGDVRSDIDIVPLRQFLLGALNWTVELYRPDRGALDLHANRCMALVLDGISTGARNGL